MTHNQ